MFLNDEELSSHTLCNFVLTPLIFLSVCMFQSRFIQVWKFAATGIKCGIWNLMEIAAILYALQGIKIVFFKQISCFFPLGIKQRLCTSIS